MKEEVGTKKEEREGVIKKEDLRVEITRLQRQNDVD